MSEFFKEYVVTLKNRNDLERFYQEMEHEVVTQFLPTRAVTCLQRRTISRNTHYELSASEAKKIKLDPRVQAVSRTAKDLGVKIILDGSQFGSWSRSSETDISSQSKNWGLYRCSLLNNVAEWGSNTSNNTINSTINFTATGKNVDVVVLDKIAYQEHSEFGERYNAYDWFAEHNADVWPDNENANYQYYQTIPGDGYSGSNNHATHVSAIIAGNTQGWAREANIYNLRHDVESFSPGSYTPTDLVVDYIRSFHNTKETNLETGRKNPTIVNNSWGLGTPVNLTNPINTASTGSRFSKIYYRGELIVPEDLNNPIVDTGYSGVCTNSIRRAELVNLKNGANNIVTTAVSATVTPIALNLQGRTSLTDLGAPSASSPNGADANDDAVWVVTLPFVVNYMGTNYGPGQSAPADKLHVSSNSYVMFGGLATRAYELFVGAGAPAVNKILISGGDRSCQKVWAGTTGTEGSRVFRVRWEGHEGAYGGEEGNPTILWEMSFYENDNTRIELHVGQNDAYRGEFTISQLEDYGIMQTTGFGPYYNDAMAADISDAIDDGVIFVSSAGNNKYKIDTPDGQDYDNYFVDNGEIIYYHKGPTPANSHPEMIVVGALDSGSGESKFQNSGTGPRVDLYAPGVAIASAVYDNLGSTGVPIATDGISASVLTVARSTNIATITTVANHGFVNGDRVTIIGVEVSSTFNVSNVIIGVTGPNTFTYANTGATVTTSATTGSVYTGNLYQKYNGSSMSTAQVTGLLALALQEYPDMTQAEARAYILQKAQVGNMANSGGGYTDAGSLQSGNNRIAYYFKERPDQGPVFPKINLRTRPSTGMIFPRPRIFKS